MSTGVQFNINVASSNSNVVMDNIIKGLDNITNHLNTLNKNFVSSSQQSIAALRDINAPAKQVGDSLGSCTSRVLLLTQAAQGISNLSNQLSLAVEPGKKLNSSLQDLSAITGVTGAGLKEIEMNARASAKAMGVEAATATEGYKVILSRLDPEIAKNSTALKMMGDNAVLLSKQLKGDVVGAAELLSGAMNSYGISTKDPIAATQVMTKMMDIMSAGAKVGAAELPQVKAAIEQSGAVAKASGVGFGELNAAIQVVAKTGSKFGAEGGTAIRNVLGELNQGTYNSPKAIAMLQQSGISIDKLGDNTLTFKQRLELLKPIANDAQKMMLLFGKENVTAGMALAQNTELLGQYTEGVNANGVTQEMANTVMESYQEKMNRIKARFDDYKISIFNATQAYLPYLEQSGKVLNSVTQVTSGLGSLKGLMSIFKTQTDGTTASIGFLSTVKKVYASVLNSVRNATAQATIAQWNLNLAMYANPVGIIIAAVVALVGIIWLLWEKCRAFREIMFGIWEAAKAVFTNIGIVVMRLWNLVIKPYFEFIWNLAKAVWTGIYNAVKWVIEGIISFFKFMWDLTVKIWTGIYNTIAAVFSWIWEIIKSVGEAIGNFFGGIWDFIKGLFSSVGSFIDEWIVQPIKNAFSGVWDFVVGIFTKIWDGLKKLFQPIIDLWNKIFSSDGMVSVKGSFDVGMKKGGESYDNDQKEKEAKNKKSTAQTAIDTKSMMAGLGATGGAGMAGGGGVKSKGAGASSGGSVGSKNTVINMTFHKLQDQTVIHTTNLEVGAKQAGKQIVEEILMALHSVTGNAIAS